MTKIQKKFNDYIKASGELVKHLNESDYEVDDFDKETDRLNDVIDNLAVELLNEYNDFSIYNEKTGKLTIDNLEIDDYIKSVLGKNYFYDKRCWNYMHDGLVDEILNNMTIIDENIIYESVELTKDFILEGIFIKKGSKIKIEEDVDSPLVGTFTDDSDGSIVDINSSDIEIMAEPLVNHLKDLGYLDENNNDFLKNYEKVIDFCVTSYQKYFKMPSFADIENLAKEKFNEPKVTVIG